MIRLALAALVRDLGVVAIVLAPVGCVLALSGVDAGRLRQIQANAERVYADDALPPVAHQFARADYCLARASLVDNGQAPLAAGPGAACEPEGGP